MITYILFFITILFYITYLLTTLKHAKPKGRKKIIIVVVVLLIEALLIGQIIVRNLFNI